MAFLIVSSLMPLSFKTFNENKPTGPSVNYQRATPLGQALLYRYFPLTWDNTINCNFNILNISNISKYFKFYCSCFYFFYFILILIFRYNLFNLYDLFYTILGSELKVTHLLTHLLPLSLPPSSLTHALTHSLLLNKK